jgi:hypothetical protein
MSNEKTINRVKKILARANSNHKGEAETAILMAQEILLKNGLTMEDVNSINEKNTKEAVDGIVETKNKTLKWYEKAICVVIAKNFRCEAYMSSIGENSTILRLIGLKEDVDVAKEIISFTILTSESLWKRYYKENDVKSYSKKHTFAIKNDYFRGFIYGLKIKLEEQVKEKALIIVKDALVTQKFKELGLKSKSPHSTTTARDDNARNAGYRDGKFASKGKYVTA